MATKKVESKIEIPAMDFRMATLHVVGDSPLIVHAWSEKAKRMMLEKQMKKATKGKEVRDPFAEFLDSLYWLSGRQMSRRRISARSRRRRSSASLRWHSKRRQSTQRISRDLSRKRRRCAALS